VADLASAPAALSLARRLERGGVLSCPGVCVTAQPFFAALLARIFPEHFLVIVAPDLKTQEWLQQDLETWQGQAPLYFPPWESLPHEGKLPHADVISDRLQTLLALGEEGQNSTFTAPGRGSAAMHSEVVGTVARARALGGRPAGWETRETADWEVCGTKNPPTTSGCTGSAAAHGAAPRSRLLVTSVAALMQNTFAPAEIQKRTRHLQRGDTLDPLDLIEALEAQGYEPEAQVTQKGEIALRGGILDIYPPTGAWPVRLEFFGNELESLREFDPATQISRQEIEAVSLPPAGELGILKALKPGDTPPAGLLEHLPGQSILVLCEPENIALRAEEYRKAVPAGDALFRDWAEVLEEARARGVARIEVIEGGGEENNGNEICPPSPRPSPPGEGESSADSQLGDDPCGWMSLSFSSLDAWRSLSDRMPDPQVAEANRREFFGQVHRWLRQGYAVRVFCNNDGERQRFLEIWCALKFDTGESPEVQLGALARGFICEGARLVVITDAEIFGRYKIQRPRRQKSAHARATRSALDIDFADLEAGDLVVHLQHGIGLYLGLQTMPTGQSRHPSALTTPGPDGLEGTECLVIEYAPSGAAEEPPKLFVPVTEAHLVGKYVGVGKSRPPLNTLGGTRWARAKEQTEQAVRDVAAEMLRIQAVRETQPGHAYPADVPWQREFESAFIYEETEDQMRAIVETKADMERPKPMDRLICGDVGFGKTEVAIRAAFKAVMGGKQAAILVPTTVLAQQHFNNFRERMADYPVRVELLSRYRTKREQDAVVKALAAGAVDIVIGTHRLVQSDIAFKDLGLVVIDEEQRFGVQHKETFKRLRTLVDVLTLSATPIPRTLYLALTGARDMSTIQTPPHDRLPVETIVTQYDERIIRDAIRRELNRGGQVFFLHNRVSTILDMADRLKQLVPDARLVVGHGQMNADDLEAVMTTFVNGQADILLSTTIIESGLDIPNANTIIIDRADRFGLSDLYQLRGRVGRYKHQAFAYLLLPRHASLLTDVRKRISAMKQYSTLGSGFKIAMRDLEIRGAGNLLGAEQSGHITAVGFELYCQLLKQSVSSLKGETFKPRVEVQIKLDFLPLEKNLPEKYITEPQHRIDIYRKLAQATDKPALEALHQELRDRFGPPPPAAELIFQVAELKILAGEKAVTSIEVKEDRLMMKRRGDYIMLDGKFPRLTKKETKARLKEIKRVVLAI
jgi:transcription-repair coupling factor (superfamily II helicase)